VETNRPAADGFKMRACVGALCEGDNRRLKKAALLSHALEKSSIVTASQRPASNSSSSAASADERDRPPRRAFFSVPPAFSASLTAALVALTHHLDCCQVLPLANLLTYTCYIHLYPHIYHNILSATTFNLFYTKCCNAHLTCD
jgi:hypothetical protein